MKGLSGAVLLALVSGCLSAESEPAPLQWTSHDAFLSITPFTRLVIDVHHAEDWIPSPLALAALEEAVEQVTPKSSVSIRGPTPLSPSDSGARAWSVTDMESVARNATSFGLGLREYGRDDIAVFHLYYLRGHFEANPSALGIDLLGRGVIFSQEDALAELVPPLDEQLERSTIIHEFGHAIGLVGCGIPMVKERMAADGCHSRNRHSVMAGGNITIDERLRPIPYEFDEDDLADIAAYQRSKGWPSKASLR